MDHFVAFKKTLAVRLFFGYVLLTFIPIGIWFGGRYFEIPEIPLGAGCILAGLLSAYIAMISVLKVALTPLKNLRQAILHVSRESTAAAPAPDIEKIGLGREMVSALAMQVYDMASRAGRLTSNTEAAQPAISSDKLMNATPLPVISVDSESMIHFINDAALNYIGADASKRSAYVGKNINDILNLSFQSELTYETWLADCQKNVVTASTTWNRVRLDDIDGNPVRQFDMAASYSKGAGEVESELVFFDHTKSYSSDDQEISFVAMAVHELRTPLTIMRGYIEVFEDELGPQLPAELKDFMFKMNASAQQLTAFVSNILNVARVEENQLTLTLHKEDLKAILTTAVQDLELRARVHGKHIALEIAADIPAVAADRISVHEVINNLVDNAIKYGGKSEQININCIVGSTGMVEVSVQDFGVGIPTSIIPRLFDKFYRSHRSSSQIGGTGLGLYLCKAIVAAHGGSIAVNSKEGEGSTFTFTLEPYSEDRHGAEANGQDGIMRGAHGWIKNHSMYRR